MVFYFFLVAPLLHYATKKGNHGNYSNSCRKFRNIKNLVFSNENIFLTFKKILYHSVSQDCGLNVFVFSPRITIFFIIILTFVYII